MTDETRIWLSQFLRTRFAPARYRFAGLHVIVVLRMPLWIQARWRASKPCCFVTTAATFCCCAAFAGAASSLSKDRSTYCSHQTSVAFTCASRHRGKASPGSSGYGYNFNPLGNRKNIHIHYPRTHSALAETLSTETDVWWFISKAPSGCTIYLCSSGASGSQSTGANRRPTPCRPPSGRPGGPR